MSERKGYSNVEHTLKEEAYFLDVHGPAVDNEVAWKGGDNQGQHHGLSSSDLFRKDHHRYSKDEPYEVVTHCLLYLDLVLAHQIVLQPPVLKVPWLIDIGPILKLWIFVLSHQTKIFQFTSLEASASRHFALHGHRLGYQGKAVQWKWAKVSDKDHRDQGQDLEAAKASDLVKDRVGGESFDAVTISRVLVC